jgi:putative DNA primase/helicase
VEVVMTNRKVVTRQQVTKWRKDLEAYITSDLGDGEYGGWCPVHEGDGRPHKTRSATFNLAKGVWHCKGKRCDEQTGSQVARLVAALGRPSQARKPVPAAKLPAQPLPPEKTIERWAAALRPDRYWTKTRGIKRAVLDKYQVGWDEAARSPDGRVGAYTFPYRDGRGRLLNVKHRWPAQGDLKKAFRLYKGQPTSFLWPEDQLDDRWLLLPEGEGDVLRAISLDLPAATGITGAGGAAKAARSFAPKLKGIHVVVCADSSPAGRKAAHEVANIIHPYAETVRIFDPFPDRDDDSDLSDWFDFFGGDVERFKNLLRELPVLAPDFEMPSRDFLFPEGTFNPPRLGMAAEGAGQLRIGPGQSLWRYEGGVYLPDGESWLAGYVRDVLREDFREGRLREVKAWCKANFGRPIPTQPSSEYINAANGILYWQESSPRLEAHSPDIPSIIQIGASWDAPAECPAILDFLETVLPENCLSFLFEWIGYLLIPSSKYQRALMLMGPGDTGKSTLLAVIGAFLGKQAFSSHTLQSICDDRFTPADLYGRLANIYADLDAHAVQSSGKFKAIVAGDSITVERKFGHPFSFDPFTRLIFSANEPPGTSDQSGAYYKRWLVLPMDHRFPEAKQDPNLRDSLTSAREMSGLLREAVRGLQRLEARGRFDVPEPGKQATARYRANTDTIVAWGNECLTFGGRERVRVKDAFENYQAWCGSNNRRSLGRQRFNEHVPDAFPRLRSGSKDGYPEFRGAGLRVTG